MKNKIALQNVLKHWIKTGLSAIALFVITILISKKYPLEYPFKDFAFCISEYYNNNVSLLLLIGCLVCLYFGLYKGVICYDPVISWSVTGNALVTRIGMFLLIPTNIISIVILLIAIIYYALYSVIGILFVILILGVGAWSKNKWWL